jgi:predicted peptidase
MTTLLLAAVLVEAAVPIDAFEERTQVYTGGEYKDEAFKYRLLTPAKIEEGKKYPLVLFLHGAGERGDDNQSQLKYLPEWMARTEAREKYPCFLIAPQCRRDKKWTEINWGDKLSAKLAKQPTDQMKVVMAILDETIKKQPIDEKRIYLTGLSMGGYGSWELAMRQPGRFAAVAPVCGGGDESQAALLKDIPIWAWHGDADSAVPVERSRRMIDAVKKAGGKPRYTELPGVGHDSWTPAYTRTDGVVPWLFEQAKK